MHLCVCAAAHTRLANPWLWTVSVNVSLTALLSGRRLPGAATCWWNLNLINGWIFTALSPELSRLILFLLHTSTRSERGGKRFGSFQKTAGGLFTFLLGLEWIKSAFLLQMVKKMSGITCLCGNMLLRQFAVHAILCFLLDSKSPKYLHTTEFLWPFNIVLVFWALGCVCWGVLFGNTVAQDFVNIFMHVCCYRLRLLRSVLWAST